jgi:hypothetical protein
MFDYAIHGFLVLTKRDARGVHVRKSAPVGARSAAEDSRSRKVNIPQT